MKYKLFEEYTEQQNDGHPGFLQSEEEILEYLNKFDHNSYMNTYKYKINSDMSVDVKGDIRLESWEFKHLRVKFNIIDGNFSCRNNRLVSLKGCPEIVKGDFDCSDNKLTSLKHRPEKITGSFRCRLNELSTLEYSPNVVYKNFICEDNRLTDLEYAPDVVHGDFSCCNNRSLISLVGGPTIVHGDYDCSVTELMSLKYCPNEVNNFNCGANHILTTLQYAPDVVHGDFSCRGNIKLITFNHKSKIEGIFIPAENQWGFDKRWGGYLNYLDTLDEDEKKSSLKWLHDVDEDFHKLIAEYVIENNIDIVGLNKDIASDALKHNDSGLF